MLRRTIPLAAGAALCLALASCSPPDSGPARIWTDVPEMAIAVELFNASQSRHLVEIQWKADLSSAIREAPEPPALAVGRFLKSSSVRDRFQSLDYLFGELVVNQAAFYPGLLGLGNIDGRQVLLPVSFNLPAIVFAKASSGTMRDFTLGMDDLAKATAAWNQRDQQGFVRMGFSPRWDPDFLTLLVNSSGASFRESSPLAWNEAGLGSAIAGVRTWIAKTNASAAMEDEFQFKYLYTPAYQYVSSGRVLFAYMDSGAFFLVPEEKRSALDYRWFAWDGKVPVSDDIVYAAIVRAGANKGAVEAFLKWFYKEDSQRAILEEQRRTRALESYFGLAGGFSALRSVNERVFPLYYPSLLGHLPPANSLSEPKVLPGNWPELKHDIVAPWLLEVTRSQEMPASPGQELAARVADYRKKTGR